MSAEDWSAENREHLSRLYAAFGAEAPPRPSTRHEHRVVLVDAGRAAVSLWVSACVGLQTQNKLDDPDIQRLAEAGDDLMWILRAATDELGRQTGTWREPSEDVPRPPESR